MFRKICIVGAMSMAVVLGACSSDGEDNPTETAVGTKTAGPLDPVQSQVSGSLLQPLANAAAGTALEGVVDCADEAVTQHTLDIVDLVLLGLQAPQNLQTSTLPQLQTQVQSVITNLQDLIYALAGQGSCLPGGGGSAGGDGSNPLAGVPGLSSLGALLPQLTALGDQAGADGNTFASLAGLVQQVDSSFSSTIAALPPATKSSPVVGGVLTTLDVTLSDVKGLLDALAANDSGRITGSVQTTVDHALSNVLTQVVPIDFIDTSNGTTTQIRSAITQLANALGPVVGQPASAITAVLGAQQLQPLLTPITGRLLPGIIDALRNGLASISGAGGDNVVELLAVITNPLAGLLNTLLGTGGSCPFASVPLLSTLCR